MAKKFITISIILGTIAFALNMIFNDAISYLSIDRVNNVLIYKYDFWQYLENIRNSFTGTTQLTLELPPRQWINVGGTNWWDDIINNLAVILDYIIFAINIMLWPLRLGAFALRGLLAIIGIQVVAINGIPIEHSLSWLTTLVNGLIEFIQIPYV